MAHRADGLSDIFEHNVIVRETCTANQFIGNMKIPGTVAGSVLFVGSDGNITEDNSNLFLDDTNKKLGVGTATPLASIHSYKASALAMNLVERGDGKWASLFSALNVAGISFVDDASFGIYSQADADKGTTNNLTARFIIESGNYKMFTDGAGTGVENDDQLMITGGADGTNATQLKLGVNNAGDYSYIQSTVDAVGHTDLLLNPLGGSTKLGGTVNYMEVKNNGDVVFVGGAGLCFGGISMYNNTTADTIATATLTQLTRFDTNDPANNTSPDHTNDHITITKAGMYKISFHVAFSGDPNVTWTGGVYKNNGATQLANLQTHRKLGAGGDVGSASVGGIADLAVNDTIEVWFQQSEGVNKAITVVDACLSVVQVGGT